MRKRILFTPAIGQVKTIPIKQTDHFEENEDGSLRKLRHIVSEYKTVPDLSERTMLRIYKDDLHDFVGAIQWITGQTEINISIQPYEIDAQGNSVPAKLEEIGKIVILPVYGTFQPELGTADDIHAICEDFRLLASHFPIHNDIFTLKTAENRFAAALMEHLIENQSMMTDMLLKLGVGKDRLKPLPAWIKRVLELRKER